MQNRRGRGGEGKGRRREGRGGDERRGRGGGRRGGKGTGWDGQGTGQGKGPQEGWTPPPIAEKSATPLKQLIQQQQLTAVVECNNIQTIVAVDIKRVENIKPSLEEVQI
jgi:hypothetical protein